MLLLLPSLQCWSKLQQLLQEFEDQLLLLLQQKQKFHIKINPMTSSNHPHTSQIIPYTHDWTTFILHNDNNNNMQSGRASSQVQMKTKIGEWRERLFHAKIPQIYHVSYWFLSPKILETLNFFLSYAWDSTTLELAANICTKGRIPVALQSQHLQFKLDSNSQHLHFRIMDDHDRAEERISSSSSSTGLKTESWSGFCTWLEFQCSSKAIPDSGNSSSNNNNNNNRISVTSSSSGRGLLFCIWFFSSFFFFVSQQGAFKIRNPKQNQGAQKKNARVLSAPVHSSGALPYVPCLFRVRFSRMTLLEPPPIGRTKISSAESFMFRPLD